MWFTAAINMDRFELFLTTSNQPSCVSKQQRSIAMANGGQRSRSAGRTGFRRHTVSAIRVRDVLDLQWFWAWHRATAVGFVGVYCLKFGVTDFMKTLPVLETLGWPRDAWNFPPPATARGLGNGNEGTTHKQKIPAHRAVWMRSSLQDVDLQVLHSTTFALRVRSSARWILLLIGECVAWP